MPAFESTGHFDFAGRELFIGDKVAYSTGDCASLFMSIVVGFSKSMIKLDSSSDYKGYTNKWPKHVVRVLRDGGNIVLVDDPYAESTIEEMESVSNWFYETSCRSGHDIVVSSGLSPHDLTSEIQDA